MTEATSYNWLRQDRIDRGEIQVTSTDMALNLAAANWRIRELETELAVSRRSTRCSSSRVLPQNARPGDRRSDRAGAQRAPHLPRSRGSRIRLLRLAQPALLLRALLWIFLGKAARMPANSSPRTLQLRSGVAQGVARRPKSP